jgi:hypothetical protein
VLGNVLHYFADPLRLLRTGRAKLRADDAVVVLEYEGARANPQGAAPGVAAPGAAARAIGERRRRKGSQLHRFRGIAEEDEAHHILRCESQGQHFCESVLTVIL